MFVPIELAGEDVPKSQRAIDLQERGSELYAVWNKPECGVVAALRTPVTPDHP